MDKKCKTIIKSVKKEIKQQEITDYLHDFRKYIKCGYAKKQSFNVAFGVALEIIGKKRKYLFHDRCSDYHHGVKYLSNVLKISSTEVKMLRKNIKSIDGFYYKVPLSMAKILEQMIEELKNNDKKLIKCFKEKKGYLYRDVLAENQCLAIKFDIEQEEKNLSTKMKQIKILDDQLEKMIQKME